MGQCASADLRSPKLMVNGSNVLEVEQSDAEKDTPESPNLRGYERPKLSRKSSASSWVNSRLNRAHKGQELSATFNMLDMDAKSKLVNINTATEEELMTLAGITRKIAHDIVEYRRSLGGFRRIEDIALVSGVGAKRLESIRYDITLRKIQASDSSSNTQSVDSLPSFDSVRSQPMQSRSVRSQRSSSSRLIDVNSASIFELMTVKGMSQEMAANIVHYREKKGSFRSVDDLARVRGINFRMIGLLKVHLTVVEKKGSCTQTERESVASCSRLSSRKSSKMHRGHRRTQSAPLDQEDDAKTLTGKGTSESPPIEPQKDGVLGTYSGFCPDIYELLSLRSQRPIVSESFCGHYKGRPAVRIATWNLQQLSKEKVSNPGVLEVICRTILENGFSLLAIQEVASRAALQLICKELNEGSLRRVREWVGHRGDWRWQVTEEPTGKLFQSPEYAAFIYNAGHGLELMSASVLELGCGNNNNTNGSFSCKPYLGHFKGEMNPCESPCNSSGGLVKYKILMQIYTLLYKYEVGWLEFVVVTLHVKAANLGQPESAAPVAIPKGEIAEGKSEVAEGARANACEVSQLSPLVESLREKLANENDIVLLGDFNMSPNDDAFGVLRGSLYTPIVPSNIFTNINCKNIEGTCCYDNIWLNSHTHKLFTGSWGVVKEGLSHLAIPSGWGWGGYVSDHCPVYCDLFVHRELDREVSGVSWVHEVEVT